ncbi:MAG: arginase [Bdellovibrionales bacterium]|jgi:arginase|nr:arginase [Bdellovibrionales bacterium]
MQQDNKLTVDIIGYDSGWGCREYGCEDGPAKFPYDQLIARLAAQDVHTRWQAPLGLKHLARHDELTTKEKTLPVVQECLSRLSQRVLASARKRHIPLVIGGDHSCAMGTWPAVVDAHQSRENFGLIWIDAHLDAHTYETSNEGKWGGWWHGQPVAALAGYGLPALTQICGRGPKLSPQHMCIIGPHSFEPSEEAFVARHGIRVFYLEEVQRRGFKAVFEEALARARGGTDGFGLSIDLDGFGPDDSPGVGTREDVGIMASEALPVLQGIGRMADFHGLEIVEFNPHNDVNGKTARLMLDLISGIFLKT